MSTRRRQDDVVLVTGFPRLVAKLVCDDVLAADPACVVRLLAREKFVSDAEDYRRQSPYAERITVLEGDAASIDLGLSGAEWKKLAAELTFIQHHANISYEGAPAESIPALNEQGAREMLELARSAPGLRRWVHQSSALVSGQHRGTYRESDLDVAQSFRSVVERSKFRAERLVRRAAGGLPITIVRPSLIVGHSVTGEIDRLDGPYLLILLILTSPAELPPPLPARGDAPLNLVPVDYVARASVALMRDPAALGRTVHLVDSTPLSAREVFERVAISAGKRVPRGFIPVNVTRALLRAPGLDKIARSPRAFVEQLATDVVYDDAQARELLAPAGITCPSFGSYVDVLVAYVRRRLAEDRAGRDHDAVSSVEDPLA